MIWQIRNLNKIYADGCLKFWIEIQKQQQKSKLLSSMLLKFRQS